MLVIKSYFGEVKTITSKLHCHTSPGFLTANLLKCEEFMDEDGCYGQIMGSHSYMEFWTFHLIPGLEKVWNLFKKDKKNMDNASFLYINNMLKKISDCTLTPSNTMQQFDLKHPWLF